MSRLAIVRLLILWLLHGSLRGCKTDHETDYKTFLSLDPKLKGDNSYGHKTAPETPACFFNCAYPFT